MLHDFVYSGLAAMLMVAGIALTVAITISAIYEEISRWQRILVFIIVFGLISTSFLIS